MDSILSRTVRDAARDWLDRLETLVHTSDTPSRADLAGHELLTLIAAWRALLAAHEPDEEGRCRQCWRHPRRRAQACAVWVAAYQHLVLNQPNVDGARHAKAKHAWPLKRGICHDDR